MAVKRGEAAVVAPVPELEPLVSSWRERFDTSAAAGMPAHITLLYPFLPEPHLDGKARAALRELCASQSPLEVTFESTARFPDFLYLAPQPADGLVQLTMALVERWPECPPYGGQFDRVIPHLTVAGGPQETLDAADAELRSRLPVSARLTEAQLLTFDGARWRVRLKLPFGRSPQS